MPNNRLNMELGPDGVAQVRLTRPDKLNALDMEMFAALAQAGAELTAMRGLRCVVLSGEGKAFCAGLDLSVMAAFDAQGAPDLMPRSHGNANLFQEAALVWRKLPVPVIAAVHGVCFGGGLQLAAGADIRISAPDARLSVMELKWGIVPDMGGFALWREKMREDVLRELTYTAREFSGAEALQMGFVTAVDADPLARATAVASEIAGRNPDAIRAAKALFNAAPDQTFDQVMLAESAAQQALLGSPNQREAVLSQMQRRPARYTDG